MTGRHSTGAIDIIDGAAPTTGRHRAVLPPLTPPEPRPDTGKHRAIPNPTPGTDTGTIAALIGHGKYDGPIQTPPALTRRQKLAAGAIIAVGATGATGVSFLGQVTPGTDAANAGTVATRSIPVVQPEVTADAGAALREATPIVSTQPAPPPPAPKPAPNPAPAPKPAAPAPAPAAPAPAAPAPAPASSKGQAIANAALAQVGQYQDCVKMVSDSLATVGVSWYDWPAGAAVLGPKVPLSQLQPGDLLYYVNGAGASVAGLAHIAIYIGDGKAVHGGWNGNETIIWSINVGYTPTPPTWAVRVA